MKNLRMLLLILFSIAPLALPSGAPVANASAGPSAAPACPYDASVAGFLSGADSSTWAGWVGMLSGAQPVSVGGQQLTITTRYTQALFNGQANARAYDFILEQLRAWHYPEAQIEQDPYLVYSPQSTWKNLVLTIPSSDPAAGEVYLTAHLDSIASYSLALAPGAEDNASGAGTLLEAARLFRHFRPSATLRLVWFTGEEQGLMGSRAFVAGHDLSKARAAVNLDMFGYDADNDRCFELHVGERPASQPVGACVQDVIAAYGLNLTSDFLTTGATTYSDHASFWGSGVGAVEILENHTNQSLPGGCAGADPNPYYHLPGDTIDKLNLPVAFDIARAGMAAAASLAGPLNACFDAAPALMVALQDGLPALSWNALPGAAAYRVERSAQGCAGGWQTLTETASTKWTDAGAVPGVAYRYRVEALAAGSACVSPVSDCSSEVTVSALKTFMPLVAR